MEHPEGFKYDLDMQQRKKDLIVFVKCLVREVSNYFLNVAFILNISIFNVENMHMHHKIFIKCVLILTVGESVWEYSLTSISFQDRGKSLKIFLRMGGLIFFHYLKWSLPI